MRIITIETEYADDGEAVSAIDIGEGELTETLGHTPLTLLVQQCLNQSDDGEIRIIMNDRLSKQTISWNRVTTITESE